MPLGIVLATTLVAQLYVLRRWRFDWITVGIVLSSTVLCVHYVSYTSVDERNYDGASHVEYIEHLAMHLRLPKADACGACGHPPLYYGLAAAWSWILRIGGWIPPLLALQWLSLLSFFGFVFVALLVFRSAGVPAWSLRAGAALVAFWPSSIINSARVHNDALASVLMLSALYFIAQWDRQGRPRYFCAALAASGLALLTKATGYTVATTLLLFSALGPASTSWRQRMKRCLTTVVVLGSVAALTTGLREFRQSRTACQQVLGSACDGRYVPPVPDRVSRFVYFDPVDFVRRIDTLPRDPEHDYFLNRLAKSSLFGVMPLGEELASRRHEALAVAMSLLLLAMLSVCGLGLVLLRGLPLRKYRVYSSASVVMLVFLVAFRARAPNPFHEDFRHVFPVLVPFCLGYVGVVERVGRNAQALRVLGLGIAGAMVACSVAFFIRV